MSDIKNVIGILCQHLNQLLDVDMKPEYFRLAKFNKCEQNVVQHFWNLLHKFAAPCHLDVVDTVKLFLHSIDYRSISFYCLPNDMSYGSRELLLALGYVIVNNEFLYRLIQLKVRNTPFNPKYNIQSKLRQNNISFDVEKFNNNKDKINAVRWMKGRIESLKKILMEMEDKSQKLMEVVNHSISITNVDVLSINEILALKKKDYGKVFLSKTETMLMILENHEKWIKKQRVFWEWMSTVIVEKNKTPLEIKDNILDEFHVIIANNVNQNNYHK